MLSLIHAFLCVGIGMFAIYTYLQNRSFSASIVETDIFIYVVPLVAMIGYFTSKLIYQKQIQKISKEDSLVKKLQEYQAASLVKYALIEGPAFLALFAYYMNGNAMHLVIAMSLLVYLFFQRPTLVKLKLELPLNLVEKKEFNTLNKK